MAVPVPLSKLFTGLTKNLTKFVTDIPTGFRGLYHGIMDDMSTLGSRIATTVTELPSQIADRITNLPEDLMENVMIGPGFNLNDLYTQLSNPEFGDLEVVLEKMTGVNLNNIADQIVTKTGAQLQVDTFYQGLRIQINNEIQNCIESYLQSLDNKFPWLVKLLNLSAYITAQIGLFRRNLRLDIEGEIDKLLYDKLKLQQIGMFKMRILGAVRGICPRASGGGKIATSLTKRFQNDDSWKLPTGDASLTDVAQQAGPAAAHTASKPNSTGSLVEQVSEEAAQSILDDAVEQGTGYDDNRMGTFVNADGSMIA